MAHRRGSRSADLNQMESALASDDAGGQTRFAVNIDACGVTCSMTLHQALQYVQAASALCALAAALAWLRATLVKGFADPPQNRVVTALELDELSRAVRRQGRWMTRGAIFAAVAAALQAIAIYASWFIALP